MSPAARARELFKPSMDSASLGVNIEKKNFALALRFSGRYVTCRGVLRYFGHFCLALGAVPKGNFLDSKFS